MINLISTGFYGKTLHNVTKIICNEFAVNYANVVFHSESIVGLKAKTVDFVDYNQLVRKKQSPTNPNDLIPLDQELISAMSNCERVAVKMMERLEPFRQYQHQYGVNLYYLYLRYWNHIIETHNINLFLSANVPHEGFDYIIYELCKLKNIPVIFLYHQSQVTDTAIIMRDWRENSPKLQQRYEYLQKTIRENDEIKLGARFEEQYQSQISGGSSSIPFYMHEEATYKKIIKFNYARMLLIPFKGRLGLLLSKVINPFVWIRFFYLMFKQHFAKKLFDLYYRLYYNRISTYPDMSKPYIYVALQYQPELSTSPLADAFVDQTLIVSMISKFAPKDVLIYVKEHPKQTSSCRNKRFYQGLFSTRNVVLARKDVSSFDLTNNARAVATSTGTPGWEALFREKPVMMFGSYIYQFADGVFNIRTNNDCVSAIKEIFINNKKPSLRSTRIFLKALEDVSIPAVIDPDYLAVSQLTDSENEKNITNALIKEIKQIIPDTR